MPLPGTLYYTIERSRFQAAINPSRMAATGMQALTTTTARKGAMDHRRRTPDKRLLGSCGSYRDHAYLHPPSPARRGRIFIVSNGEPHLAVLSGFLGFDGCRLAGSSGSVCRWQDSSHAPPLVREELALPTAFEDAFVTALPMEAAYTVPVILLERCARHLALLSSTGLLPNLAFWDALITAAAAMPCRQFAAPRQAEQPCPSYLTFLEAPSFGVLLALPLPLPPSPRSSCRFTRLAYTPPSTETSSSWVPSSATWVSYGYGRVVIATTAV